MEKLVECVPNFSEGRDLKVLEMIADSIRAVPGCTVLDVDPGYSTNRTVLTFVGSPEAVVEGAFAAAKKAKELIDMRNHSGEHARMGAMDVCPFVPVRNVTVEECVECARKFGEKAGKELGIPIYLYEDAADASKEYRIQLKQIREGEYEGLSEKIIKPEWKPDFGPAEFIPTYGATVTGCRFFLIAYNINLLGTKEQAHRIGLNLREAGRGPQEPGRLAKTKAIGWYVDEYNMAQISMNVDDFRVSPFHICYEEAKKDAQELNLAVAGSELVGLIPLEAMLLAADYYIEKENLFILDERQKVRLVIERLGLSSVSLFDPDKKIVEYMIKSDASASPLLNSTIKDFVVNELGARKGAPGGGSAAAVIASIGASLGTMVGLLSYGMRKFESLDKTMRKTIPPLYTVMNELLPLIDLDTKAYEGIVLANRLPKDTPELEKIRNLAIQSATKVAIAIPLKTMRTSDKCWEAMIALGSHCNINSRSDLEVGAKALETGIYGAHRNVLINADGAKDILSQDELNGFLDEAQKLMQNAMESCKKVLSNLEKRN